MATAIKLRSDIRKLKKAIDTKGISASIKDKLKSQLQKAESELASMKKGKKPSKSSTGGTKTALSKLQSIIKKKKYGAYRAQGVDLKKDADRPALRSGKRTSKSGNTYYEYRANRIDVKQPPKRYPKLEDGGMMADGGEINKDTFSNIFLLNGFSERKSFAGVKFFVNKKQKHDNKIIYSSVDIANKKVIIEDEDGKIYYDGFSVSEVIETLKKLGYKSSGGYMAGGGNVSKSYEKIEGTDYELKIQVYYDKGGMNYFTSRPEARGYYLSVSPVQVERRENGIMVESYAAFSGIKALVLPVQRQSPKAEKQAEELAQKMMPELKEQVTSNLKRKLGMMKEGGMMEMREVVSEEQQMAKGGQIDDLVAKQTEFLAQLTDIKLGADLETEEGVLNYRNQITPIRQKLSVIEDELEMLGYEAYEKGGYMKKGGLTLGDISKKYDENEDINYHTENVVLLATHFGTADDLRDAKTIKAKHDAIGHLPFNLYQERNELGDKLYQRMIEQIRENGMGAKPQKVVLGVAKEYINPDYMAKGGEMHRYEKGGYMAKGGKSQGYDDREDERLSMEHGKIADKDFVGTHSDMEHSRRDDARFEERMAKGGYMADGGEMVYNYVKIKNYPTFQTEEEAKKFIKIGKPFLRKELKEGKIVLVYNGKEYFLADVKEKMAKGGYMAKGGATQHGLKRGDTIWADQFWENTVIVDNPETGRAVVNLETGKRKEQGKN